MVAVATSAILSLGLAEAAVRVADPFHSDPGLVMYHPVRGNQLVPGFRGRYHDAPVYVDQLGFRDRDRPTPITRPKSAGAIRVMVFGDSFTFGDEFPIESSFVYQLEQRLRNVDSGRRWEFINAGVPGYNSVEEALYIRETAAAFSADLVVLEYTMRNASDYHPPPPYSGLRAAVQPAVDWLRVHSYLYNFLYAEIPNVPVRLQGQKAAEIDWNERYARASPHYQAMRAALKDLDEYLVANGIPLIFLIYGLGPGAISSTSPPPPDQRLRDYPLAPMHLIVRSLVMEDMHARYVDALDVIGSMTQREVYEGRNHPGTKANAGVAAALAACALDVSGSGFKPVARSSPCPALP